VTALAGVQKTGRVAPRSRRHFDSGFFSMSGDIAMMQLATETSLPPSFRLYGAVVARANIWGHAAFAPGELSRILRDRSGDPCSDKVRRGAINALKSAKVVAPNSTSLCVVIDAHLNQRADRATRPCKESKHSQCDYLVWLSDYGYESSRDAWKGALAETTPGGAMLKLKRTTTTTTTTTVTRTIEEEVTGPAAVLLEAARTCSECGEPAIVRQGIHPVTGPWQRIFCMSGDGSHTEMLARAG
jgi:transposase InsO family protein